MYKMTQRIYDELKNIGDYKVFTDESEHSSQVWLQFGIKNGGSYRIRFISRDDDNDVAVRVFALVSVEEDNRAKILPTLNNLNARFRYIKFVMDDDGDINLEYDYPVRCPNPVASAEELIIRIVKMVDETYPELMRAMWAWYTSAGKLYCVKKDNLDALHDPIHRETRYGVALKGLLERYFK